MLPWSYPSILLKILPRKKWEIGLPRYRRVEFSLPLLLRPVKSDFLPMQMRYSTQQYSSRRRKGEAIPLSKHSASSSGHPYFTHAQRGFMRQCLMGSREERAQGADKMGPPHHAQYVLRRKHPAAATTTTGLLIFVTHAGQERFAGRFMACALVYSTYAVVQRYRQVHAYALVSSSSHLLFRKRSSGKLGLSLSLSLFI